MKKKPIEWAEIEETKESGVRIGIIMSKGGKYCSHNCRHPGKEYEWINVSRDEKRDPGHPMASCNLFDKPLEIQLTLSTGSADYARILRCKECINAEIKQLPPVWNQPIQNCADLHKRLAVTFVLPFWVLGFSGISVSD